MQELEGISDKWLDPESDPIGARLQPVLEEVIEGLGQTLGVASPEIAETFRKRASLRVFDRTHRRAALPANLSLTLKSGGLR